MPTSHRTPPPQWLEAIVSALLPPSRREQVLGDLKERCIEKQSYATLRYILDALTTLPHVWWSCTRRSWLEPPLKLAGASNTVIRERTEYLLNRLRNQSRINAWVVLFTMILTSEGRFRPSPFSDSPVIHLIIGLVMLIVLVTQPAPWPPLRLRPQPPAIEPLFLAVEKTRDELLQAYRNTIQEMSRSERKLPRPIFSAVWLAILAVWFIPNWPPIQDMGARGWVLLELVIPAYALCVPLARFRSRRLQQELDGLDLNGPATPTEH